VSWQHADTSTALGLFSDTGFGYTPVRGRLGRHQSIQIMGGVWVLREAAVSTALIAQTALDYVWLAPLPPTVWLLLRTAAARTVGRILRVCAWDVVLRLQGVSETERLKLIAEAAERDLKSS
jgi:hypothetical protein